MQCCGVKDPSDWDKYKIEDAGKVIMSYPMSCCNIPSGTIGTYTCSNATDVKQLHKNGCVGQVVNYIKSHAGSLGAAGICFAILQV